MKTHKFLLSLLAAVAMGSVALHADVINLARYVFTHPSGSLPSGWNSDDQNLANMDATDVAITGAAFVNNTANELRFTDTATTSFSSSDNFLSFQLTADSGYYFDFTDALSLVQFKVDRNSGGVVGARMQVFAGTDGTGSLLYTTADTNSSVTDPATITETGSIAAINSINQYDNLHFQVQWRNIGTAESTAYRFDNFRVDGNLVQVPEPSTFALMGMALVGVVIGIRRRK